MFEAMHTGHSVYSTFHASNVEEAIARLTNPPINLPKKLLSSIGLMVVQHRNRRTGKRRTFQVAEVDDNGNPLVIMQHDSLKDVMNQVGRPNRLIKTLSLYTGMKEEMVYNEMNEKISVLKWLVEKNITDIHTIGLIMSDYYTEKEHLMNLVRTNKDYISLNQ
jgi:flagellar protein FlaI